MNLGQIVFFFSSLLVFAVQAQVPPQEPATGTPVQAAPLVSQPIGTPDFDTGEVSDLVLKNNSFTYDSEEGRDPFKVFREDVVVKPGQGPETKPVPQQPGNLEKNILTAAVPAEVILLGILYKKVDPIALVSVRGVKGLNKLTLNSPIGRNEGKIIAIQKDKIIIEQVKDFDGQKFTEKVELKVREKKN